MNPESWGLVPHFFHFFKYHVAMTITTSLERCWSVNFSFFQISHFFAYTVCWWCWWCWWCCWCSGWFSGLQMLLMLIFWFALMMTNLTSQLRLWFAIVYELFTLLTVLIKDFVDSLESFKVWGLLWFPFTFFKVAPSILNDSYKPLKKTLKTSVK